MKLKIVHPVAHPVNLSTQRRCGAHLSVLSVLLTRKASDSHLAPCDEMELLLRLHARKEKGEKKSVRKCEIVTPVAHPGDWGVTISKM